MTNHCSSEENAQQKRILYIKRFSTLLHKLKSPITIIYNGLNCLEKQSLLDDLSCIERKYLPGLGSPYSFRVLQGVTQLKEILLDFKLTQKDKNNFLQFLSNSTNAIVLLNKILNIILLDLSLIETSKLSGINIRRLNLMLEETDRLKRMLNNFLLLEQDYQLRSAKVELNELLSRVLLVIQESNVGTKYDIRFNSSSKEVNIFGDQDQLIQAFINIFHNACDASPSEGRIFCDLITRSSNDQVNISVRNFGTPIPAKILPNITQPFVTSKSNGTGLGLAIVKQVVERHNGKLIITSSRYSGTKVTLYLPTFQNPSLDKCHYESSSLITA